MLATPSLGNRPIQVPNLKSLQPFFPCAWTCKLISIKMHSTESRFVIWPSYILFAGILFSPESLQAGTVKGLNNCCACSMNPVGVLISLGLLFQPQFLAFYDDDGGDPVVMWYIFQCVLLQRSRWAEVKCGCRGNNWIGVMAVALNSNCVPLKIWPFTHLEWSLSCVKSLSLPANVQYLHVIDTKVPG